MAVPSGYGTTTYVQRPAAPKSEPEKIKDAYNDVLNFGKDALGINSKNAVKDAKKGLGGVVAPGFQALGNEMWNRSIEGSNSAQRMFSPSESAFGSYAARGPGQMENAYAAFGGSLAGPSATSAVAGDANRILSGPNATQRGYDQATGTLAGADNSQYLANQYGAAMQNPTASSQYGGQAANRISGPSGMQQAWGDTSARLGSQGAAERFYADNQGALSGPGMLEANAGRLAEGMGGPRASQGVLAGLQGGGGMSGAALAAGDARGTINTGMAEQQRVRDEARRAPGAVDIGSRELGDTFRQAGYAQDFAGSQLDALRGPSLFENQAEAAFSGNDPLHDRIAQRGRDAINQEMIARGKYNSGGAEMALGNYQAESDAQLYQKKLDLARQAGEAQRQRIGAGQSLAGAASGEALQRGGALQGLAGDQRRLELAERGFNVDTAQGNAGLDLQSGAQMDASALGRTNAMIGAAENVDRGDLQRTQTQADIYGRGQSAADQRLSTGGRLAGQAQSSDLARTGMSLDALQGMDAEERMRASDLFGIGQGMDSADLARWGMAGDLGGRADATALGVAGQQFGMGQGLDEQTINELMTRGQLAGQTDEQTRANLALMFGAAGQAQGFGEQRANDVFDRRFGIDQARASNLLPYYQQGAGAYGDANSAALNTLANMYGLGVQGAQNQQQNALGLLKFGATL